MRVNILCAGKVLGAAIKTDTGVAYAARPFATDTMADMAETEAPADRAAAVTPA